MLRAVLHRTTRINMVCSISRGDYRENDELRMKSHRYYEVLENWMKAGDTREQAERRTAKELPHLLAEIEEKKLLKF